MPVAGGMLKTEGGKTEGKGILMMFQLNLIRNEDIDPGIGFRFVLKNKLKIRDDGL
jgi:hypothetical protein